MLITISLLIISILITFETRFILKYFRIKRYKQKTIANVTKLAHVKGSFGHVPIVDYVYENNLYNEIKPIHSSFTSYEKINIKDKISVQVNAENPNECIINADLSFYSQIIVTVFIYCLFFYSLFV